MKNPFGCFLFVTILLCSLVFPGSLTAERALAGKPFVTDDLHADGCLALRDRQVLVLYVARDGCPYCRALEADVLSPLLAGGRWPDNVLLRQISVAAEVMVQDFDQNLKSSDAIANELLAGRVTPVLHFLDGYGNALTRPLVGYNGSDFFPVYLERALSAAVAAVSVQSSAPVQGAASCENTRVNRP